MDNRRGAPPWAPTKLGTEPMHPALFAQPLPQAGVECQLCPHYCRLQPGQTGICRVRHNIEGALWTSAYGRPVAVAIEPIEKKYFFHVLPGARTLSLGVAGCNLGCQYCINWRVSQRGVTTDDPEVTPEAIVERALAAKVAALAFTYTEPTIFFEYAQAIAHLARQAGLAVVAKSNGYMTPTVLESMAQWLTAINIDLKGWHTDRYQPTIKGQLAPVLATLKHARRLGLWLEVSTLITPGVNADPASLQAMAAFIATELGPDTPWHLQRFFPNYRMLDCRATAQTELQQAVTFGQQAGLRYLYCKELEQGAYFNTRCPACHTLLLERTGFHLNGNHLTHGGCPTCGLQLPGIGFTALGKPPQAPNPPLPYTSDE